MNTNFPSENVDFPSEKRTFLPNLSARKGPVPSREWLLIPKRLLMAKTSFHEILMAKLEENSTSSPETPSTSRPMTYTPEWSFTWQAPTPRESMPTRNPYPRSVHTSAPSKDNAQQAPPPPVEEKTLALSTLKPEERAAALKMIEWGAIELTAGVSASRLKRAYRRLAKRFHPDHPTGSALQFRELKGLYECLKRLA